MPISERWTTDAAALLVIDLQETLLRLLRNRNRIVANTERLVRAAKVLDIPVMATEQYPKGLGPTVGTLASQLPTPTPKTLFHAADAVGDELARIHVRRVTIAGIEAHVCVAQTALELLTRGYAVQVPADAVGSRSEFDAEIALRRLERAGAVITTTEAVLFEWAERSDRPEFKAISALVKDFVPPPEI